MRSFVSSDASARNLGSLNYQYLTQTGNGLELCFELLTTNLDRFYVMLNNFTTTIQVLAYSPFMTISYLTVVSNQIVSQVLRIISSGHWTSETFFRDQSSNCSPPCCFKGLKMPETLLAASYYGV